MCVLSRNYTILFLDQSVTHNDVVNTVIKQKTKIKPHMKFEKKINIIELITLITLVVGGVLGYLLNKRYDAILNQSNIQLTDIQVRIAEIEERYKKRISEITIREKEESIKESNSVTELNLIKTSINEIEKIYTEKINESEINKNTTSTTLNVSDFLIQIQPNLKIEAQKNVISTKNSTLKIIWEIENIGKHTVVINDISFLLSEEIIYSDESKNTYLKEGEDYSFDSRIHIGELPPGQKTYHYWEITLKNNFKPKILYHYTKFSCEINPAVKSIAKEMLSNKLSENQINHLTTKSYGRHGWINISYKEHPN